MEYPYPILEERINNSQIKIIGVLHTKEFFEEQQDFLKQQVKDAEAILVESGDITTALENDFYRCLIDLAGHKKIPVYTPDVNRQGWLFLCEVIQVIVGAAWGIKIPFKYKNETRREFLKRSAKFLGGLYLLTSNFFDTVTVFTPGPDEKIIADDAITYNTLTDYRNIVIAENLDKLTKRVNFRLVVPFFIGAAHARGIHAYLKKPELRKKRILYAPQDAIVGDTISSKYEFLDDKWQLVEKF